MLKFTRVLVVLAVVLVAVIGCQKEPASLAPTAPGFGSKLSGNLASTDAVESATLYLFVTSESGQAVTAHRITSDWDELTVTWNSFGEAFDATVYSTTVVNNFGWQAFDITSLVQAWEAGTYPNKGLLLDQDVNTTRQWYFSSDVTDPQYLPYVVLCMSGGVCDTIFFDKDTYINENEPDVNFGAHDLLATGNVYLTREKQTLIYFPFEVIPELAAIGDTVWYDTNQNGIQDADEAGVPDVTVELFDCQDNKIGEMTTDANGYYLFSDLQPGDYYVRFTLPTGYQFTLQDQGSDDAIDSDADPVTGKTVCTTLEAGETDVTWDAGIFEIPEEGCTRTIGYWKTHAGFGPQADAVTPLLPIWLGTFEGAQSLEVTTAAMAVDVLSQNVYGTPSNGITKLYAQLLGAKLNIAAGASDADVASVIADADAFLATHSYSDWSSLSKTEKAQVLTWQYSLDQYNNGFTGPGHCE